MNRMATDEGNRIAMMFAKMAQESVHDSRIFLRDVIRTPDADALLTGAAKVALAKVEEARSILATALADMERISAKKPDL